MSESTLIGITIFIYMASWLFYLAHVIYRQQKTFIGTAGDFTALAGFIVHTIAIVLRWVESHRLGIGHAPFSNLYESMVFFSWTIVVLYLVSLKTIKVRVLGMFVMPVGYLTLASTSLMKSEIQPLIPALQSNWLTSHVITCFLGYAAFAVAFIASLLYLIQYRKETTAKVGILPSPDFLDDFSYRMIAIGFPLMTLGIITGSAWAHTAWGSYWSWDPKETWSLIVWLIYAAYLHARIARGWRGRPAALLSIFGFAATLFCYLGVNLWLAGLHSYATG